MSPRRHGRGRGIGAAPTVVAPEVAGVPPAEADQDGADNPAAGEPSRIGGPAASEARVGADPRSDTAARPGQASRNDMRSQVVTPGPRRGPRPAAQPAVTDDEAAAQRASCTLAQMRRFIKSRPYVPVHELRRRFVIDGIEDEVSPMAVEKGTLYVGLPEREAGFLGELVKAGEVGCELLLDPTSPAVVGVYPMRPVARQ